LAIFELVFNHSCGPILLTCSDKSGLPDPLRICPIIRV
jgi:hypothetical protein